MKVILLLGALSVAASAAPASKTVNGLRVGEQATISGLWFTNFENSRFLECDGTRCEHQSLREWAAITCPDGACEVMDKKARALTNSRDKTPPTGTFKIRFVGRRGVTTHPSRYLGDGERDVLIEHLLDIQKAD